MKAWIYTSVFGCILGACTSSQAEPLAQLTSEEFRAAIPEALRKVDEFEFIRTEAQKLGVHVWLFGGSTASFANYLRWFLLHQKGDSNYQAERFDFDFLSIFRGNQDLDLVIDGTLEQAEALETRLQEKFPYMKGGRSTWEVRLLKTDRGENERLMGSSNFDKQNSDSASTALCEISEPKPGEERIVDLRNLHEKKNPVFLQDLLDGKIRYYDSPEHFETKRFQEGKNPKIISAIRYLIKAFQFEYRMDPLDVEVLRKIISDFDPSKLDEEDPAFKWIQKNAVKLYENSIDVEFATEVMEKLGLRKKLRALMGNINEVGSLAWWMSKEPLPSLEVGKGNPAMATAKELGLSLISHSTRNLTSWECISRSPTGRPNLFKSREGKAGEGASYGDGVYALAGTAGAMGPELSVQFILNPNARLGWDFELSNPDDPLHSEIIIKNRAAITLVPTKYMEPIEFFNVLAAGKLSEEQVSAPLRNRIHKKYLRMSEREQNVVDEFVRSQLASEKTNEILFSEWRKLPKAPSLTPLEFFQGLRHEMAYLESTVSPNDYLRILQTLELEPEKRAPVFQDLLNYYKKGGLSLKPLQKWLLVANFESEVDPLIEALLKAHLPGVGSRAVMEMRKILGKALREIGKNARRNSVWDNWVPSVLHLLTEHILSQEKWMKEKWVKKFLKRPWIRADLVYYVFSHAKWKGSKIAEAALDQIISDRMGAVFMRERVLPFHGWDRHPKLQAWVQGSLANEDPTSLWKLLSYLGERKYPWTQSAMSEVAVDFLSQKYSDFSWPFLLYVASNPYWQDHPQFSAWMERALEIVHKTYSNWDHRETVEQAFKTMESRESFVHRKKVAQWRERLSQKVAEISRKAIELECQWKLNRLAQERDQAKAKP